MVSLCHLASLRRPKSGEGSDKKDAKVGKGIGGLNKEDEDNVNKMVSGLKDALKGFGVSRSANHHEMMTSYATASWSVIHRNVIKLFLL